MSTITHLLFWDGIGGALLKISSLLLLALGLMNLLGRAEPRWRVGIARTALVILPLLLAAHSWAPKWQFTVPAPLAPAPELTALQPNPTGEPTVETAPLPLSQPNTLNWPLILTWVWAIGAAIALFREIWRLTRLRISVRAGASPSQKLTRLWQQIESEFALSNVELKIVSENSSPFVAPGFQRRIAIPRTFESQVESNLDGAAHALRHEAAHLRSNDGIWIPLIRLAACTLWFHPLIWWLAAAHLRACEEACDAAAARKGGVESYRQALAQLALDLVPVSEPAAATFLRAPSVLKRLHRVSANSRHRPPRWWVALPLLLTLALLGGTIGVLQVIAAEPGKEAATIIGPAEKLKRIQVPRIEFVETPLDDAIAFLAQKSIELDTTESEPAKKGINFIIDLKHRPKPVTLNLSNVSLEDALRYTVRLGGVTYEVEPNAILINSLDSGNTPTPNPIDNLTLQQKANTIIIPSLQFQDTPLKDAIAFLRARSKQLDTTEPDPAKKGLNILLEARDSADVKISLRLSNIPLAEALRYCAQLAQLRLRYEESAVILLPPANDQLLWVVAYKVPDTFLDEDHVARENLPSPSAMEWARKHGIDGPKGFSLVHNRGTNQLIVRATEKAHDAIAKLIPRSTAAPEPDPAISAYEAKLKRIVIPQIEFQDTPIESALQFLALRSKQLDTEEADPAKKGINLIIRDDSDAKISLRLSNVPLSEALRYTAQLAGMKVEIQSNAVVIAHEVE
tara:strand:- start:2489 stop:4708 length:2220 start_codon:yes stop_codon:yes gene_type:complete